MAIQTIVYSKHNQAVPYHKYHSKDLRKHRYSAHGQTYLVTTNSLSRKPIFSNAVLDRIVADEIRRLDDMQVTRTYAYVIMPDHLHWLFQLQQHLLPTIIRILKGRSARRVNKIRNCDGAIWQSGYHDRTLRAEESLEDIGNYIVANPVRGGIVSDIEDYPLWDMLWRRRRRFAAEAAPTTL